MASTDTHQVGFRRDSSQPNGIMDKPTWSVDTRFGLQLSAKLGETLLGTLQVVSKYRYDGTYKPELSWGCLAWNPVSNLQIRAGYLAVDILPHGDFSNVGYTYLWVRPPVDVFGSLSLTRMKGLDVSHGFALGAGTTLQVKAFGGTTVEKVPVDHIGDWDMNGGRFWGVTAKVASGAWRGRVSASTFTLPADLPEPVPTLQKVLTGFGAQIPEPKLAGAAAALATKGVVTRTYQAGVAWEQGRTQAQGTLYRFTSDSFLFPSVWSGFASFGYRLGQVVPYGVFSRVVTARAQRPDLGALPSMPGPLAPVAQEIVRKMDILAAARGVDQHTLSAGLRWDFIPKADLKFQVDSIRSHNATGLVFNPDPNAARAWDGRMTVMTVTLDFIFGGGR